MVGEEIKIRVLGPLAVERRNGDGDWEHVRIAGREPPGLLAILSATKDEVSRTDVLTRMRDDNPHYPDQHTYDWTSNLRDALDVNRSSVSKSVIETNRRSTIRLRREAGVWVDYDEFKSLRERGNHADALRLVRGDLAENLPRVKLEDLRGRLLEEVNESRRALELAPVESPRLASRGLPGKGGRPAGGGAAQAGENGDRTLDWETFHAAVGELGSKLFADRAYGGFWPDAVVGVNHGGAIVAGLLFYTYVRTFEIFIVAAREGDFVSGPSYLNGLAELADGLERPIRVLLVDDSMKTGESLRLARSTVDTALGGRESTIRVAVLVYRPDFHAESGNDGGAPDHHVHTEIDHFPYGPV